MNATMFYYFLPIGMNAIYVLCNKICATIVSVKRLLWIWWKSSKSR